MVRKEGSVLFNNTLATFYFTAIWHQPYSNIQAVREKTCCHHLLGYSFQLAVRDLLYTPSRRQDRAFVRPIVYLMTH